MTARMQGKRVLVTGAGTGIGRGVALEFAKEGAVVALHYSSSSTGAQSAVEEILKAGGKARAFKADFKEIDSVEPLAREVVEYLGGLDVLINNAGMTLNQPFEKVSHSQFNEIYNINIRAQYFLTQALVPEMVKQGGGAIVNISSIHAYAAMPGHSVYAGTKGAIVSYTRELALELAPHKIRVNGIAPGFILIEKNVDSMPPGFDFGKVGKILPAGRVGTPWDVARLAIFLASDEAGYILGQTIQLDGGHSIVLPLVDQMLAAMNQQ